MAKEEEIFNSIFEDKLFDFNFNEYDDTNVPFSDIQDVSDYNLNAVDKSTTYSKTSDPEIEGGQRKEGDRTVKKPGRKPLTSEPATKRKAQNRSAQRAFRERKEKYLRDLELKVSELARMSEKGKQEISDLRGQVKRLNHQLRTYQKRLSLQRSSLSDSIVPSAGISDGHTNNFQSELPNFSTIVNQQTMYNGSFPEGMKQQNMYSLGRQYVAGKMISPISQKKMSSSHENFYPENDNAPSNQQDHNSENSIESLLLSSNVLEFQPKDALKFNPGPSPVVQNSSTNYTTWQNDMGISRVFEFNKKTTSTNSESQCASSPSTYLPNTSSNTLAEPSCDSSVSANDNQLDVINEVYPSIVTPNVAEIDESEWFRDDNNNFEHFLFNTISESENPTTDDIGFSNPFANMFIHPESTSSINFDINALAVQGNSIIEIPRQPDNVGDKTLGVGEVEPQMSPCQKLRAKLEARPEVREGTIDINSLCHDIGKLAKCSEFQKNISSHEVTDKGLDKLLGIWLQGKPQSATIST